MKFEALVALLLSLITAETAAQVGSGPCRGKIVDVFVESSYLSNGASQLDPDTYVQVRVASVLLVQFKDFHGVLKKCAFHSKRCPKTSPTKTNFSMRLS